MPMATGAPKDLRLLALAGGVWLALACGHTDPFTTSPPVTQQPFDPAPPIRLTYNAGADRFASWLPDGSGILYSAQQVDRPDHDLCLAMLPPDGGTQTRLICDFTRLGRDTTNAIESAVLSPAGQLAFFKSRSDVGDPRPTVSAVAVGTSLDPVTAQEVQRIPYTLPGELPVSGISALRWQTEDRLLYVGGLVTQRVPCENCPILDTIRTGYKITQLDLGVPGSLPAPVPGTDFASGLALSGADEILYTLSGDSRVYRRSLSTGGTGIAFDFGAAGVARDLDVAGGRLAAVVGGRVHFSVDPELGPIQWDSGGVLHVVDLATGEDHTLDPGRRLFRRPALSPGGDRLVAEGSELIIVPVAEAVIDTTVSKATDLFLLAVP
jgi:hypothetical protein